MGDDLLALDSLIADLTPGGYKPDPLAELDALVASSSSSSPQSRTSSGTVSTGPGMRVSTGPGMVATGPGMVATGVRVSTGPGMVATGPGMISTGPGRVSTGPGMVATGIRASTGPGPGVIATGRGIAVTGPMPGMVGVQPKPGGRGGGGIGGIATSTPDGRQISVNAVTCVFCNEAIVGKVINAMGKTFHPEHFVCETCQQPFPNGQFIEHQGKAYCEPHYNEVFAPRCASCEQPILGNVINALGKSWHREHFCCAACGKLLAGKSYKEAGGEAYCDICKLDLAITIDPTVHMCAMCKKPIIGEYILLKGQHIHPEHYQCGMCGKKLRNGDCFMFQGKYYCKEDYDKLQIDICAGCGKPITGRSITAMGRVWHPEHFCCAYCHAPFNGRNYYVKDGMPYDEEHFKLVAGKICAKCDKAVIHNGIETLGKIWHMECFVCQACDKEFKEKDTICEYQDKPMCKTCYLKLPSDVRKKIEKKKKEEKKMEMKRQKGAAKEAKNRNKEAKKQSKEAKSKMKKEKHPFA